MPWTSDVIRFWFEELKPKDWFASRPELDAVIADRFAPLRARLKESPPDPASLSAAGHIAAVVVFDQFSRNMFRGSPEAFATDALALTFAEDAIERGMDKSMGSDQRHFLYMPFMHSEDLGIQLRSLALFRGMGLPEAAKFAEAHKAVIDRFGRFPGRNRALGRVCTAEEQAWLDSGKGF